MCRVIDRIAPAAAAVPGGRRAALAEIVAQWADRTLFWTAVPYTMQPAGVAHLFDGAPPECAEGLRRRPRRDDRRHAPRRRWPTARAALQTYLALARSACSADGRPFLLGAQPCIADFSVAQSIWFIRRAPPVAAVLDAVREAARPGIERVAAFGHGTLDADDSDEAIAIAAQRPAATRRRTVDAEPGLRGRRRRHRDADRLRARPGRRHAGRPERATRW